MLPNNHGSHATNPDITLSLLAGQYESRAIIPLETVRQDFFPHLAADHFMRKLVCGEIPLPFMRTEESQRAPKGVHLSDLAAYLDHRRSVARRLVEQMTG